MNEQEIINRYNGTHTFGIGFSGGKDSTATLLYLTRVLKLKNVKACFADTGWEADVTYEYLDYIENVTGIEIVRLQALCGQLFKKPNPKVPDTNKKLDMLELAKIKGRFPSSQRRFCSTELKLVAQQKWISEQVDPVMNVSGVRREESTKRRNAPYFVENDEFLNGPNWLPIVDWTWEEVFDIHKRFNVEPNPLYKKGFARVGCFPCIMANKNELGLIATEFSERFDKISEMEKEVAKHSKRGKASFFSHDTVPMRYRRQEYNGVAFCSALDVRDWAIGAPADDQTIDMFSDDDFEDIAGPSCNSIYGLCE